ncbi:MAG: hypothetical protein R3F37_19125 [Candidatus Competibacteraceae bacterium]
MPVEQAQQPRASRFRNLRLSGEYVESSEGDQYSRMRLEESHAQYEVAQGRGNAGILSGALFTHRTIIGPIRTASI